MSHVTDKQALATAINAAVNAVMSLQDAVTVLRAFPGRHPGIGTMLDTIDSLAVQIAGLQAHYETAEPGQPSQ